MDEAQIKALVNKMFDERIALLLDGTTKFVFQKNVKLMDGRNIQAGRNVGLNIGTETTQKIGFWNKTPIIQPTAITSPSGGATIDSQARTAIDAIRTALINLGLTA